MCISGNRLSEIGTNEVDQRERNEMSSPRRWRWGSEVSRRNQAGTWPGTFTRANKVSPDVGILEKDAKRLRKIGQKRKGMGWIDHQRRKHGIDRLPE